MQNKQYALAYLQRERWAVLRNSQGWLHPPPGSEVFLPLSSPNQILKVTGHLEFKKNTSHVVLCTKSAYFNIWLKKYFQCTPSRPSETKAEALEPPTNKDNV